MTGAITLPRLRCLEGEERGDNARPAWRGPPRASDPVEAMRLASAAPLAVALRLAASCRTAEAGIEAERARRAAEHRASAEAARRAFDDAETRRIRREAEEAAAREEARFRAARAAGVTAGSVGELRAKAISRKYRFGLAARVAADAGGVEADDVMRGRRLASIARARHVMRWLLVDIAGLSLSLVGRETGDADHTSARHSCCLVRDALAGQSIDRDDEAPLDGLARQAIEALRNTGR